jgi:hypothetical protein
MTLPMGLDPLFPYPSYAPESAAQDRRFAGSLGLGLGLGLGLATELLLSQMLYTYLQSRLLAVQQPSVSV